MSKTKNFWHEEITNGMNDNVPVEENKEDEHFNRKGIIC